MVSVWIQKGCLLRGMAMQISWAQISSPSLGGVCSVYVLEARVALCTEKKDGLCCFKFTILIKLTLSPVEYLCTLSNAIYFMQLGTSSVTQHPDFPRPGGSAGFLVQNFWLILSNFLLIPSFHEADPSLCISDLFMPNLLGPH